MVNYISGWQGGQDENKHLLPRRIITVSLPFLIPDKRTAPSKLFPFYRNKQNSESWKKRKLNQGWSPVFQLSFCGHHVRQALLKNILLAGLPKTVWVHEVVRGLETGLWSMDLHCYSSLYIYHMMMMMVVMMMMIFTYCNWVSTRW